MSGSVAGDDGAEEREGCHDVEQGGDQSHRGTGGSFRSSIRNTVQYTPSEEIATLSSFFEVTLMLIQTLSDLFKLLLQ